ncbi:MAG TPA: plastocyanin/azurin family copper-binding protein, partial [Coriobacteriia bacterium]|nr:plastocyanin/azurin family copper-binding protein [Coriobacteriia bacterium]
MTVRRALLVGIMSVTLLFALAACSASQGDAPSDTPAGDASAGATTVVETGLAFDPQTLEVSVGDTVTFKNEDAAAHNVNIDGKDLGTQAQGESVTWMAE